MNVINKLGFKWLYWYGLLTPPITIFSYWLIDDSYFIKSIAKVLETRFFQDTFPGSLAIDIFVLIIGVLLPIFALSKIKCPQCKTKIVWHNLNHSEEYKEMDNAYTSACCPKCGFDPENRKKGTLPFDDKKE